MMLLQRKQKSKFHKPPMKLHLTEYTYQSIKFNGNKQVVTVNLKAQYQFV